MHVSLSLLTSRCYCSRRVVVSCAVGVRVRPLLTSEVHEGSSRCLRADYSSKQIILGNDTAFTFDNVFSEKASQKDVYETSVLPLVDGECTSV